MNVVDIVIVCLIAAAFVYAVRKMFKKSASGSCANCDAGCACPTDDSHCCGAAEDMVARMEKTTHNFHRTARDK